jgi:spermidine/putrescine transport system ATP-binding protein
MSTEQTSVDPVELGAGGEAADDEAIRFEGVTKRFGGVVAVDDVSLSVRRGEFFSLLGPSGCGKTTTLRMIAGFEQPTDGSVYLEGAPVDDVPPYQRNVNTVFQGYALFEHLDVEGNVAFGLKRRRVAKDEIGRRVAEALELVQLTGREHAKPRELSGGQMQRVALARALVNRPAVLLLDEPLGALDLKLRKQMQVELKRIQQEVKITFIYVTHDQEEAMTMSDRIAVMNHGRYEQLGDPEVLYERPQTRFVAGFLGVSNLLPATPDVASDGYAGFKLADGTGCRVPRQLIDGQSGPVAIGVRPEKIRLSEAGATVAPNLNRLSGVISDASYLGVSTQYIVSLGGGRSVTVYEQNVERATKSELWTPGEAVQLTWLPEHSFVVADAASATNAAQEDLS